jgi:hypothetical protein
MPHPKDPWSTTSKYFGKENGDWSIFQEEYGKERK